MNGLFPFSMNIRQKVFSAMLLCLAAIAGIGGFSYRYLNEIENRQHLSEITDDLSNTILEIRRSEKNYFFFGSMDDLKENRKYVRQAIDTVERIMPDLKIHNLGPLLTNMRTELISYDGKMAEIELCLNNHDTSCKKLEDSIRDKGRNLAVMAHDLVNLERHKIFLIIAKLKNHLAYSIFIFLLMGGFLAFLTSWRIVKPLKTIERATRQIAKGDFKSVRCSERWSSDEAGRVMEAFNRMITELEKRQEQLVQAQKLSSIGIMAAGIAHQLNNPLNNISTSCQIILEEIEIADRDFIRRMLESSEQEVQRARDIVRGLLEFSRTTEFSPKPSSLSELVHKVIKLVSGQIYSGIEIKTDIPEITVNMDTGQMQEVFINLVLNSGQAIGDSKGTIWIRATEDNESRTVDICIEDTGPGIATVNLSQIFDPFFTTKEEASGTGLGLSIAYGIVKQHMGRINAENIKGGGARFLIRLPLYR